MPGKVRIVSTSLSAYGGCGQDTSAKPGSSVEGGAKRPGHFDAAASSYDAWYRHPVGQMYDRLEKQAVQSLLPRPANGSLLLDVGCGTGHWSAFFAEQGFHVVGLDISGPMLLKARKKRVAGAQFLQADAGIIPFGDSTFDVVAAITVLEFVPQPGEVLKEMARCARAGGRLLVGVLNRWSYLGLSRRIWGSSTFRAARFFSRPELKRLLSPHGRVRVDSVACILPWRRAVWAAHFIDRLATVMALPLGDFLVGEVRL